MQVVTSLLCSIATLGLSATALAQGTVALTEEIPWDVVGVDPWGQSFTAGDMQTGSGTTHAFRRGPGGLEDLGDLAGGIDRSDGKEISDDGSCVVGFSSSASGYEAFRWTAGNKLEGLGDLPGGAFHSSAYGISGDGAWIVGGATDDVGMRPVRWHADGTLEPLGSLAGGTGKGKARAASADGSVIVGVADSGDPTGSWPFRWTAAGGLQPLGLSGSCGC